MESLQKVALVFTIIGAVVWGLIGLFDFNLVEFIFGDSSILARIIYTIVGICGLINIWFVSTKDWNKITLLFYEKCYFYCFLIFIGILLFP